MPRKPMRQCSVSTCKNLVEKDGDVFCKEHMKEENKKYNSNFRKYDANKRYDSRWKKLRKIYINSHPFCEECMKENIFIKATVVHHIKPIDNGGDKYDISNLKSLCQHHHMSIHKNIKAKEYKF